MIKRGVVKNKKAQMQISFGMLFSIILIIIFIVFAFYAIRLFINTGDEAKAAKFINDIQEDIDRVWNSAGGSETREYGVPGYADFICFIDFSSDSSGGNRLLYFEIKNKVDYVNSNLAFYPVKFNGYGSAEINNIDMEKTTTEENPLCFEARNGKVSLVLKKDFGEALVTVEKTR